MASGMPPALHFGLVRRHMSHFSLKFFCSSPCPRGRGAGCPWNPRRACWRRWPGQHDLVGDVDARSAGAMTATLTSAMSFLTILRALIRPATVTQAVPC